MIKKCSYYCGTSILLWLVCVFAAVAQQPLRSGYFLDGFYYRHQLNPAFAAERNYISIPVLGNINIEAQGNIGVSTFLYPYQGDRLTTFLNESVGTDEFIGKLKDRNRFNVNLNLSVLSFGFHKWGGFNTFDINLKSSTGFSLPSQLFEFMKLGMQGESTEYRMDNINIHTNNYAEVALGHSRQINERLRVGGKFKLLVGLGNASVKMNDVRVNLSQDKWMVQANGEMNTSVKGLYIPTKQESGKDVNTEAEKDLVDWENIDFDTPGLSGMGAAIDLGASYKLNNEITLSAALLDFGFISWRNTIHAVTSNKPWEFSGFQNIAIDSDLGDDDPNSLESQIDDLGKGLEEYASFHRRSTGGSRTAMLGATLNLGAEYVLPVYRKLKFGFLSTTRINGKYSWSEGRLSANVAPVSWFEAGVNYGLSSFGSSFGWIINFHPAGFNFFIGMDHLMVKVTPQYFPVHRANANFSIGFNVPFGKKCS